MTTSADGVPQQPSRGAKVNGSHDVDRHDRRPSADSNRTGLLAGLPVAERRLQVAGVSTAILEGGEGPPLILLHGGIECGGLVWGPVVSQLARIHRLVVPDLPGLGESDPVAHLDATTFNAWFAELLDLTCGDKPTLVAHSLSGGLAAGFAVRYGALLERLVIYGSPAVGPYRPPLGLQLAAIRFGLRPSERNGERLNRWFILDLDRTRDLDRGWWDAFDSYCRSRGTVRHVERSMSHLLKTQGKQLPAADLERIDVPTSLLWGRHDRAVPLRIGEHADRTFGWPRRVIDDSGHVPHIEQPEAFLRALSEFVPAASNREAETP